MTPASILKWRRPATLAVLATALLLLGACTTTTMRIVQRGDQNVAHVAPQPGSAGTSAAATEPSETPVPADEARDVPLQLTDYGAVTRQSAVRTSVRKASLHRAPVEMSPEAAAPPVVESTETASAAPDIGATSGTVIAAVIPSSESLMPVETDAHSELVAVESSRARQRPDPFDALIGTATRWRVYFDEFRALHSEAIWSSCAAAIALASLAWAYSRRRRKREWWFRS